MNISEQSTVSEIVAQDYRTASVFKKYGIDFCCNGNHTIAEACEKNGVPSNTLTEQLQQVAAQNNETVIDYNSWPLDLLADYIEKKHHRYVTEKIQEIQPFLQKIVKVHGDRHPELTEVEDLFTESVGELTMHMKKEELMLFPFIRKMVNSANSPVQASFGTVQNPISVMMQEHDAEGDRFHKIAALTNNYTPPEDACNTYRITLSLLKEFEEDLHLHIHLENNILFPKSIIMEKKLAE